MVTICNNNKVKTDKMSKNQLPGLDWQILEIINNDGRISISDIATQLNRSRSSISEHIEHMQLSGIIKGFSAEVDPEKIGLGLKAFVRLSAPSSEHRKVVNLVVDLPEVTECHVLTGAELLLIQIVARDMPHLRGLVDQLTQYGSTQTDIVFASVKQKLTINQKLRNIAQAK
jgi:Lrp/AsnC family transcriptional regulator, leucine-responsive regulatory protein